MAKCACKSIGLFCLLWGLSFAASFSLSSGGLTNNAHSLSVGGANDGISFSQSQSGASVGNEGSGISGSQSSSFAAGLSGISGAESNSFNLRHPAFGGNSQANGNSFALGEAASTANGNVVNGHATSGAQSAVGSVHSSASSSASSGAGFSSSKGQGFHQGRPVRTHFQPNYQTGGVYNPNDGRCCKSHVGQGSPGWMQRLPSRGPIRLDVGLDDDRWRRRRPEVVISTYRGHRQGATDPQKNWAFDRDSRPPGNMEAWTESPLNGPNPGTWSQGHREGNNPNLQISGASASASAVSNAPGGFAHGSSSSHGNIGPSGPSSWTNNRVQTSGNAQSQAQGGSAAIGHHLQGDTQGSFSSAAVASNSQGNGNSHGNAASGIRGGNSRGQVVGHASGQSFAQGTANAGSFNNVKFPAQNPRKDLRKRGGKAQDPVRELFTEIGDTVADIFDI